MTNSSLQISLVSHPNLA